MTIASIQKTSLIDYPNKISAIVFSQGCNLRCGFCYNPQLTNLHELKNEFTRIKPNEILQFLQKRRRLLDAVVITGGEPTLHHDLSDFIKQIKALGYLVKLDTNGLRPAVLANLLKQNFLDYVAMDIKAPIDRYQELIPLSINSKLKTQNSKLQLKTQNLQHYKNNITESIKIITQLSPDYEFRSTLIKGWHSQDNVEQMAQMISGAKKYFLQKFVPQVNLLNPAFKKYQPFSLLETQKMAQQALKYVNKCEVRGY